jgi:hypothetical protein
MHKRRSVLRGLLGLGGAAQMASAASEEAEGLPRNQSGLFFSQRDKVVSFAFDTGLGSQVGTAEGNINGTTIVNFQFVPISQTSFTFDNRVQITDIEGEQIIFKNVGTGRFLIPSLSDPSSPLGNLLALGGPLVGTYEGTVATKKYRSLIGRTFPYRAVATNPEPAGSLGSVYVEVYFERFER